MSRQQISYLTSADGQAQLQGRAGAHTPVWLKPASNDLSWLDRE